MNDLPFEVCFNRHAIHDGEPSDILKDFTSMLQGLLSTYNSFHDKCEKTYIYYDISNPIDFLIGEDFKLGDALEAAAVEHKELVDFFYDLSTRAPFDSAIDSQFYETIQCAGFVAGGVGGNDAKIFHFALLAGAYMISLPCHVWQTSYIQCNGYSGGRIIPQDAPYYIKNIWCDEPEFYEDEAFDAPKSYEYENCKLHVCYKDHSPPHIHVRNNEWCALVRLDGTGRYLAGRIPPAYEHTFLKYISDKLDDLRASWDAYNP